VTFLIAVLVVVGLYGLGFLSGLTYAEANLGRKASEVRKEQGRRWWR
jgi:hypothetical protein